MEGSVPDRGRTYPVQLGATFASPSPGHTAFATVQYEFRPQSVDATRPGMITLCANNHVSVELPNQPGASSGDGVAFQGVRETAKAEALLIFEPATQSFRLERLSTMVKNLRHHRTRQRPASELVEISGRSKQRRKQRTAAAPTARSGSEGTTCNVCQGAVTSSPVVCARCDATFHAACAGQSTTTRESKTWSCADCETEAEAVAGTPSDAAQATASASAAAPTEAAVAAAATGRSETKTPRSNSPEMVPPSAAASSAPRPRPMSLSGTTVEDMFGSDSEG